MGSSTTVSFINALADIAIACVSPSLIPSDSSISSISSISSNPSASTSSNASSLKLSSSNGSSSGSSISSTDSISDFLSKTCSVRSLLFLFVRISTASASNSSINCRMSSGRMLSTSSTFFASCLSLSALAFSCSSWIIWAFSFCFSSQFCKISSTLILVVWEKISFFICSSISSSEEEVSFSSDSSFVSETVPFSSGSFSISEAHFSFFVPSSASKINSSSRSSSFISKASSPSSGSSSK